MGSLLQATIALLFLWNVSVIKCAPTRAFIDAAAQPLPIHFTSGSSSGGLGLDNAIADDTFPRNTNYWSRNKQESEEENGDLSQEQQHQQPDEFSLPTIYQLRRHWAQTHDDNEKDYASSASLSASAPASPSATANDRDEGGGVVYGDSFRREGTESDEIDSRNPDQRQRPDPDLDRHPDVSDSDSEPKSRSRPILMYNLRSFVYPERKSAVTTALEAQYRAVAAGAPNGEIEYYKAAVKRSPMCLRKCMAQGLLHPAQCHSLC